MPKQPKETLLERAKRLRGKDVQPTGHEPGPFGFDDNGSIVLKDGRARDFRASAKRAAQKRTEFGFVYGSGSVRFSK